MSRDPLDPLVTATVLLNRIVTPGHAQRSHPFPSPIAIVPFSKEAVSYVLMSSCEGPFIPLGSTNVMKDQFFS